MKSILLKASAGSGKTTRLTEEVFNRISYRRKIHCRADLYPSRHNRNALSDHGKR